MRKNEKRLKSQDITNYSDDKLLKFTFKRKSFYRDYKLLYGKDPEAVDERVQTLLYSNRVNEFVDEVRLCFEAANQMPRPTYHFNVFVTDLLERYHSEIVFSLKKKEIGQVDMVHHDDPSLLSYKWVMQSNILSSYQRYLLFEYLVLGYSIEGLASRRYCTTKTISNHLKEITKVLEHHSLE
jgi:hypothetical protein